jgi:transcriptional regulator with XRE-family HTH domain
MRVLRRQKGLTLEELAQRSNLDKSYVSRLERGLKSPSIGTLMRIAAALDVGMGELFGEATAPDAITVVRGDAHASVMAKAAAETPFEIILPADGRRRLSAFILSANTSGGPETADHPGDELIYVLEGSIEVIFADRAVTLKSGDCIHFDGHLKHRIVAVGRRRATALVVVASDLATRAS